MCTSLFSLPSITGTVTVTNAPNGKMPETTPSYDSPALMASKTAVFCFMSASSLTWRSEKIKRFLSRSTSMTRALKERLKAIRDYWKRLYQIGTSEQIHEYLHRSQSCHLCSVRVHELQPHHLSPCVS